MGLFSFGSNKSKSSSTSNAQSYIDPQQQQFLNDIRSRAQMLNQQGMPVEGVAQLNPTLMQGMDARFGAGQNMMGAGGAIQGQGMGTMLGSNMALNYAGSNLSGMPSGVGMALNSANRMANMGQGADVATGSGLNQSLMNQLTGSGAMMSAAQGNGINNGMAQNMAGMAASTGVAQQRGINTGLANRIGNMTTFAGAANNAGLNPMTLDRYINNDLMQGQIDAASRDVVRNLQENQLTGNAAMAAGSGNSGSSRRAVMDAIAQRGAADRVADISAGIRGNAYQQAVGLEAQRMSENAGYGQQANLANAAARNNMMSQGVNVAAGQEASNAANRQQSMLANQGAYNAALGQGFGIAAGQSQQNVGNLQQANMNNQNAYNSLLSQGANLSDAQMGRNLGFMNQGSQFNAGQFNNLLNAGANLGMGLRGQNFSNQQFSADLANRIGQQGVGNILAGANLGMTGANAQSAVGNELRAYEQQLLNNIYQQQMSPYNALNFYNQIVGAPTVLNQANSSSTSKSSGFNFGI